MGHLIQTLFFQLPPQDPDQQRFHALQQFLQVSVVICLQQKGIEHSFDSRSSSFRTSLCFLRNKRSALTLLNLQADSGSTTNVVEIKAICNGACSF